MILKKIIIVFIIINLFICNPIFADEIMDEEINLSQEEITEVTAQVDDEPSINSKSAIIYDRDTNMVLFEKNGFEKRAMASTTKIMTAIVVLEQGNLKDMVTVSRKSCSYWWFNFRIENWG